MVIEFSQELTVSIIKLMSEVAYGSDGLAIGVGWTSRPLA
jgi:hypothetical protein